MNKDELWQIVVHNNTGMPPKEIAAKLQRSLTSIKKFLKDPEKYQKKNPGGRPQVLDGRDKRRMHLRVSGVPLRSKRSLNWALVCLSLLVHWIQIKFSSMSHQTPSPAHPKALRQTGRMGDRVCKVFGRKLVYYDLFLCLEMELRLFWWIKVLLAWHQEIKKGVS